MGPAQKSGEIVFLTNIPLTEFFAGWCALIEPINRMIVRFRGDDGSNGFIDLMVA